jgi:hypothetical protein
MSYNWDAPPPSWRKRSMIALGLLVVAAGAFTVLVGFAA